MYANAFNTASYVKISFMRVFGRLHLLKHIIAIILYPWICYIKGNCLITSTEKRRNLKRSCFHQHRYLDWKYIKPNKKTQLSSLVFRYLKMSRRGAFSSFQLKRVSCRLAGIYIRLQQYVLLLLAWKRQNKVCTFFKIFFCFCDFGIIECRSDFRWSDLLAKLV
jgi:hypothetical protein